MSAPALDGRRVVVTGGLGLIGSRVARAAAAAGASVRVIDALVSEHGGHRQNLERLPNVEVAETDLACEAGLPRLLEGAEIVFNLAGQRSHTDSIRDPLTDLRHNAQGQLALLEACRAAAPGAQVLFASTRQVYGRVSRIPADESERLEPRDINGIHKVAAERYHVLYRELHGLPTTVLRLTNTYGPGMRIRDARQGFLSAWIRAVLRGDEFEVWGGSQLRDFNYVDDVVDAFLRAAADSSTVGGTYNLGAAAPLTLREVAEVLVDVAGTGSYRVVPLPPAAAAIDIGDYAGDYSAFAAATGWTPQVELREGLDRTVSFFREHAAEYL